MFTTRANGASCVSPLLRTCSAPSQAPVLVLQLLVTTDSVVKTSYTLTLPIHQLIRATCVMTTYTLLFSSVLYPMGTHSQV
jgi:hypothetical protein